MRGGAEGHDEETQEPGTGSLSDSSVHRAGDGYDGKRLGTGTEIESAGQMAEQLEPLLGPFAKYFFAIGILSAGVTSAITAPLAAAYATSGTLGWERNLRGWRFRAVWAIVLVVGTVLAALATNPVAAIVFAQAANGILLPLSRCSSCS
jgi:manganese transport protein